MACIFLRHFAKVAKLVVSRLGAKKKNKCPSRVSFSD